MFEHLVESGPRTRQGLRPSISALAVHAGVAVVAMRLSGGGHSSPAHGILPIPVVFEVPSREPGRPGGSVGARPLPLVVGAPPAPVLDLRLPAARDLDLPGSLGIPGQGDESLRAVAPRGGPPGGGLGELIRATAGILSADEAPVLLRSVGPVYPPVLRAAGIEGIARVEFVVDTLGLPDAATVRVVEADLEAFGEAAAEAILRSRYRAGRANGRPVWVWVRQVVRFTLR